MAFVFSSYQFGQRLRSSLLIIATAASSVFCQTMSNQVSVGIGPSQATKVTAAERSLKADSRGERPSLNISGPGVLAVDAYGNVYVTVRDGVFKVDPLGICVRVAGTERDWDYSGSGGPALRAGLNPRGVAIDLAGNLYLSDASNNRIRKLAAITGGITTLAGDGTRGFSGDGGLATSAQLDGPTGVAVDIQGNLYIADGTADGNTRIRKVATATGLITTVAGTGLQGYSGDGGAATLAQFSSLGGLATDASGNLYIADNFNNRIRMVSAATGVITTVAGNGVAGLSGDGGLAINAEFNNPLSVAVDAAGNLFIADSGNYRIRKVTAATGAIATIEDVGAVYRDAQHGFPFSLAVDAAGNLYIADSGTSRIRRVPAGNASQSISEANAPATPFVQSFASTSGFKINITYDSSVPVAAQTGFNSLVSIYEGVFTTNITVNIDVTFGNTGLGQSLTQQIGVSYSAWRDAMIANALVNPGNSYAVAAAASLPASDPIGNGSIVLSTANARALGLTANTAVDSSLTFSNSVAFEYSGVATPGAADFMDVAAHELNEALGIGSALSGLPDNAAIPSGDYSAEDYFRYSAAGIRAITTNPGAFVYFSPDGGTTNVAQFNQAYSAQGNSNLDRNDWVYGNFGCPSATMHTQDAIECLGQAVAVGSGPEITVLSTLGYDSSVAQTITFNALGNVTFGVAPFSIIATASSGLPVSLTSTTTPVCTLTGTTVNVIAAGACSITASQPGNATYAAAVSVTRSFTVSRAAQTIAFGALGNVTLGVAPFGITATATSGLAVSFTSTTTAICTVSASTVTIIGAGNCSITASQIGNTNYAAATPVVQSFIVNSNVAPTGVSVTPSSGSGSSQTFGFAFSDPNGFADLPTTYMLVNSVLNWPGSCYTYYDRGANALFLLNDGASSWMGPVTPGSGTNVQNSQCTLSGAGSSVSSSVNNLTVNAALAFKGAFSGVKNIYLNAVDSGALWSNWQLRGNWTVPAAGNQPPTAVSVIPSSGSGSSQTFGFVFSDPNGFADLSTTYMLVNSVLNWPGSCYTYYDRGANALFLLNDGASSWMGPVTPGSGMNVQNSQCTLNGAGSSVSSSVNNLTVNEALTFKPAFAGAKNVYLNAVDSGALWSNWQLRGNWTAQ